VNTGWVGFTLLKALCDDAQSQGFSLDNGFVLGCAVGQYARQFNDFSQPSTIAIFRDYFWIYWKFSKVFRPCAEKSTGHPSTRL